MGKNKDPRESGIAPLSVVYGLVFALLWTIICAAIYAIVVVSIPLSERTLPVVARAVVMLGAFLGGMVAGRRSNRIGWLHGGLVGLAYIMVTMLLGNVISPGEIPAAITVQRLVIATLVSALGGVAGVNL